MDNIKSTKEENLAKKEANEVGDNTIIYDCRWWMNFNGTSTPTSIGIGAIGGIEAKTLTNIVETEKKTHEEILAGWDALIKKIEDERYSYFWNKGYDDYLHSRPYQGQEAKKDDDAYFNGWMEARDKFTKDRR